MIPNQLQNPTFRFIKVLHNGKAAFEKGWQDKANYPYDSPQLQEHIGRGGNVGIIGGFGNLIIIDQDKKEVEKAVSESLPRTFSVRTPGKSGRHSYFLCKDLDKPIRMVESKMGDIGDVQAKSKYVVCPPSKIDGKCYAVEDDTGMAEISAEQVKVALRDFIARHDSGLGLEEEKRLQKDSGLPELNIMDFVSTTIMRRRGMEYQGEHPIHGSDTGMNFTVNSLKNVWHCFRCDSGGGPLSWIAVKEGILQCNQALPGALRGDVFKKLLGVLEEKYKIKVMRKKGGRKKDDENKIKTCFADVNGVLLQQVKGGRFCVWNGNGAEYKESYPGNNGSIYVPISGEEVEKQVVLLAEKFVESPATKELIAEIIELSRKYVDMPEEMRYFNACFVLHTWVFDKFLVTPYCRFLGDTGTGKSRAKDFFGAMCYNYISASGAATIAPVYRIIDKWKPTLGFEESDWRGSDETNELIKIINCGLEKFRFVMRCDKEKPDDVQFFDPFCPKIFSSRKPFVDQATESRCLSTIMEETSKKDIPTSLPFEFWEKEALELRNKLLGFRLKNWRTITNPGGTLDLDVEPRLKQIANPLLPLFVTEDEKKHFFDFLVRYQEKLREGRANSFTGQILQTIIDLAENGEREITCKKVGEEMRTSTTSVSRESRALGFTTELRHIYVGDEDRRKRKAIRSIVTTERTWDTIMVRYFGEKDRVKLPDVLVYQVYQSPEDSENGGTAGTDVTPHRGTEDTKNRQSGTDGTVPYVSSKKQKTLLESQNEKNPTVPLPGVPSVPSVPPIHSIKVIFLQDLNTRVMGENGNAYGPYNTADIAELPPLLASTLIKEKIAAGEENNSHLVT